MKSDQEPRPSPASPRGAAAPPGIDFLECGDHSATVNSSVVHSQHQLRGMIGAALVAAGLVIGLSRPPTEAEVVRGPEVGESAESGSPMPNSAEPGPELTGGRAQTPDSRRAALDLSVSLDGPALAGTMESIVRDGRLPSPPVFLDVDLRSLDGLSLLLFPDADLETLSRLPVGL